MAEDGKPRAPQALEGERVTMSAVLQYDVEAARRVADVRRVEESGTTYFSPNRYLVVAGKPV